MPIPIPPVGGEVAGIARHGHAVAGDSPVEDDVAELDRGEALEQGRVRITLDVGEGVVLAVDRDPFAGAVSQLEFAHPEAATAAPGVNRVTGDMT